MKNVTHDGKNKTQILLRRRRGKISMPDRQTMLRSFLKEIFGLYITDLGLSYSLWCSVVTDRYAVSGALRVGQRQLPRVPHAGKRRLCADHKKSAEKAVKSDVMALRGHVKRTNSKLVKSTGNYHYHAHFFSFSSCRPSSHRRRL